jgi:hypothetical protein
VAFLILSHDHSLRFSENNIWSKHIPTLKTALNVSYLAINMWCIIFPIYGMFSFLCKLASQLHCKKVSIIILIPSLKNIKVALDWWLKHTLHHETGSETNRNLTRTIKTRLHTNSQAFEWLCRIMQVQIRVHNWLHNCSEYCTSIKWCWYRVMKG